jgi:hypothetical protein
MEGKDTEAKISLKQLFLGIAALVLIVVAVVVVKDYMDKRQEKQEASTVFGGFTIERGKGKERAKVRVAPELLLLSFLKTHKEDIKSFLSGALEALKFALKENTVLHELLEQNKGKCSAGTNRVIETLSNFVKGGIAKDINFYKAVVSITLDAMSQE